MNDILGVFCQEIVECLVKYGSLDESVAKEMVSGSKICEVNSEMQENLLFHETPYYWAMTLLYPDNPYWYQDSKLWPPPKEYLDK